jgi:hypothetical protein
MPGITITDLCQELAPDLEPGDPVLNRFAKDMVVFVRMLRTDRELHGRYRAVKVDTLLDERDANHLRSLHQQGLEIEQQRKLHETEDAG